MTSGKNRAQHRTLRVIYIDRLRGFDSAGGATGCMFLNPGILLRHFLASRILLQHFRGNGILLRRSPTPGILLIGDARGLALRWNGIASCWGLDV
jgi:hypothetical protein